MATITTKTVTRSKNGGYCFIISGAAGPTDTIELSDLPQSFPHVFAGVQMFNIGGTQIIDSAGTFTVTMQTINSQQDETIDDGPTIDATAPTTSSAAANVTSVKMVPAALSDTVTWKMVVTCNRS